MRSLLIVIVLAFVGVALARVHTRVQTTLTGYEIGKLKNEESRLLEERANLRMQLAKLTTKKHLMLISDTGEGPSKENRTVAKN